MRPLGSSLRDAPPNSQLILAQSISIAFIAEAALLKQICSGSRRPPNLRNVCAT
jgi:hypothetical protein